MVHNKNFSPINFHQELICFIFSSLENFESQKEKFVNQQEKKTMIITRAYVDTSTDENSDNVYNAIKIV